VLGHKGGVPVDRGVEWLVDTGADISAIRHGPGSAFDVQSVALTASPTTGGGGIQVVTGLTAEFEVEDSQQGAMTVQATKYAGIKSANAGSNVLGMAHVAEVGASVVWDPVSLQGNLQT
jgi:hypothetical protein